MWGWHARCISLLENSGFTEFGHSLLEPFSVPSVFSFISQWELLIRILLWWGSPLAQCWFILGKSCFEVHLDLVHCVAQAFSRAKLLCFFGPLFPFHELKDLGFSDGPLDYAPEKVLELGSGQHLWLRGLIFRRPLLNHAVTLFQVGPFLSGMPFKGGVGGEGFICPEACSQPLCIAVF